MGTLTDGRLTVKQCVNPCCGAEAAGSQAFRLAEFS